ncbi:reticulocyte binding protein 2 homolog b-like [Patiria miniata]|uniref:SHSP domain-containing protein n=1 Tax=Patiria miniata TaxID=46514 RepID=A0A914B8D3_PATMI|nr:reticulocyte binding protein 2 homolog b-like [Patiria miniata]
MMSSLRLPKICAVALLLAAAGTDGRIPLHQSGSSCNQPASNRPICSVRSPSSAQLMNSFFREPWVDHHDPWHDPFGWGHHFLPIPLGISHQPFGAGLSILGPRSLSADRTPKIGCQRCQDNAAKMNKKGIQNEGPRQQKVDPGCQGQESDDQWHAQKTQDDIKKERQQKWREEQQQQMEEQRHHQEARQRMLEEEELKQRQEERRLEEERWRQQKRQQEEEARRQRQLWEEEELRIKKELREKQEREAAERRIQEEQAMKRRRMQEQKVADERKRRETGWNHPSQGTKDNIRNRHGSSHQNQHQHFRKIEVASLDLPGYTPEDLSVTTSGNRLVVEGKHVCDCHEQCTEKEFKRGFEIPRNIDPTSLEAKLVQGGRLTISGNQYNTHVQPTGDLKVSVEGDGSFSPRLRNVDPTCGGTRTGFKLKKMNRRTGKIVEDVEDLVQEMHVRRFEDEVNEDGITMEVEY